MARSSKSKSAQAVEAAQPGGWARADGVLSVLAPTALVLIVAQFGLAGFGAFTMDKTPTDNAYGVHVALGLVIAVLTLLMLAAVLASRPARAHARTRWLTITLVLLAVPVQTALGEAGKHVPALGAMHALNGLAILAATSWLTWATARRRQQVRAGDAG